MPTLPVLKGKFGSTEYYLARMKAKELSERLTIPKELESWDDMTIEERFQRNIDYKRVRQHIAPYLANDEDRFFGAFIVDIYNSADLLYEPLDQIAPDLPGLYANASKSFGFLHFGGGEVLVPLDGQHRLAALRFAITGKDEKNNDIAGMSPNFDVANDDVSVIFIYHDASKARKIFNKVNRYAKSTSRADNLITADDDIVAVITREDIAQLIEDRLINYQSNTLSKTSPCFTTLSTMYDSSLRMLSEVFNTKIDTTVLPDLVTQKLYRDELKSIWEVLLSKFDMFKLALSDTSEGGDEKRCEIRENFLTGKPIVQLSIVIAMMRLRQPIDDHGSRLSVEEICRRFNLIDWKVDNPVWQRVLLNGERIVSGRQASLLAGRFIAYLAGELLEDVELKALLDNYANLFPADERASVTLPQQVSTA